MIKKITILFLILILALTLTLVGCQTSEEDEANDKEVEETKEPIKIGAIISLTGPYSTLGAPEKNTLEMEVEKINKDGGVDGREIELIIEDDATDEAKAVAAATKLIEQDKVIALIGATGTGQTMAFRKKVEDAGIPQVSMAGGNVISDDLSKWIFTTPPSNRITVPVALEYLEKKGLKKIGLLTDSGGFGKDGKSVIEEEVKNFDLEIVSTQEYNPTDVDMKAQLTKIKGTDAQVVLAWTAGKGASIIAKNMKELNMDIPFVGSHGIAMEAFIKGAEDAANGVVFPIGGRVLIPDSFTEDNDAKEVTNQYVDDYTAKYDEKQSTFGGHAYDALHILVNALKSADSDDPADLRDAIEKTADFAGIAGMFNYSPTDHMGLSKDDVTMIKIEDGAWVEEK